MEKMKMEMPGLVSSNVAKLGRLFPNCITETKDEQGRPRQVVNLELLSQMLSEDILPGEEQYAFTWVGKKAAVAEANRSTRKTLRPILEESRDWEQTENLYIKGDNLEALKLLQESCLNAVRLIYIDPPYNTGHDFIYPDSFLMEHEEYAKGTGYFDEDGNVNYRRENGEKEGKYHSNWCSMMYARLLLSRNLLTEDGVILINMDEHEITNLQKLCAEVFGEINDLGTMVWDKRNPKGDARGISCQHEYIVAYARNKAAFLESCSIKRPKKNAQVILLKAKHLFDKISPEYTLEDANRELAEWMKGQKELSGGERAYHRMDEKGQVYRPVSMAWPNKKKAPKEYFVPLLHPMTHKPCPVPERGWRNPPATMQKLLQEGKILFGKDETTIPNSKYLLKDNLYENIPSLIYYGGSDTEMLSQMHIPFDTPKAVSICEEHILSLTGGNDVILDFFSGSGTTAHAVMQANAKDGQHRKYIMIQLPEPIAEHTEAYQAGYQDLCQLGMARIRRAGEKIQQETGVRIDTGFRVLKVDESNMKEVYYSASAYEQSMLALLESNIKPDRSDLDLLFGCLIEWGLPLTGSCTSMQTDGCIIYDYNNNDLAACFAEQLSDEVLLEMAARKPRRAVFCDHGFDGSAARMNAEELFRRVSPDTRIKVI